MRTTNTVSIEMLNHLRLLCSNPTMIPHSHRQPIETGTETPQLTTHSAPEGKHVVILNSRFLLAQPIFQQQRTFSAHAQYKAGSLIQQKNRERVDKEARQLHNKSDSSFLFGNDTPASEVFCTSYRAAVSRVQSPSRGIGEEAPISYRVASSFVARPSSSGGHSSMAFSKAKGANLRNFS